MRDILHFSHANGFPAPVYRKLFAALNDRYTIGYLDMIGHDPRFPVTDSWPHLVEETLHTLDTRYGQPVIGVGHSLGGSSPCWPPCAGHRRFGRWCCWMRRSSTRGAAG